MRALAALFAGLILCAALPAAADVVSERPDKVALTIYPDADIQPWGDYQDDDEPVHDGLTGLAMITEWRTIEVPAGETVLVFRGVADGIVPETAALQDLHARMVEQNQDYDLLSPGSLFARSVGARVKRVRTDPVTGKETVEDAVIRSAPNGVVLETAGGVEALGCGGVPERLVFERAPEGLTDRPTLSMRVRVKEAGRYRVRLSYLAVGLLWSADYVAAMRDDGRIDLTGWITLKNISDTSFVDAPTQFVAGELEETGETDATAAEASRRQTRCWPMDTTTRSPRRLFRPAPPSPMYDTDVEAVVVTGSRARREVFDAAAPIAVVAEQADLGDYKLYSLPIPTTVAARQTKQVAMLQKEGVAFDRVYTFTVEATSQWDEDTIAASDLLLRTKNLKERGLGVALPLGRMAVMRTEDDGRLMWLGTGRMRSIAVGEKLELGVPGGGVVQVRPQRRRDWIRGRYDLTEFELAVTNTTGAPATFEAIHAFDEDRPIRITSQTLRHQRKPEGLTWTLALKPGEEKVLRYVVRTERPKAKRR